MSSLQTRHTERVDALELLGATFVDKKRDLLGALKYWKRAMDLRYLDSNNIVQKPEPKQLIMAYDYAREVSLSFHSFEEMDFRHRGNGKNRHMKTEHDTQYITAALPIYGFVLLASEKSDFIAYTWEISLNVSIL